MSKNFISDPRKIVKPGDIVKVKVLEVEVARKRIALTLRLDDETGGKKEAKGSSRDGSRTSTKASRRPAVKSSDGALAEALRRASEKGDRGKKRP